MNRRDFLKVIGADQQSAEYLPVACLLRSGYGCVGYFNSALNTALDEVCTLLNVRVMGFGANGNGREHAVVKDFNEFLEDVVMEFYKAGGVGESSIPDVYGKSIPLSCIRYDEIAILYPVAQIGRMMQMFAKVKPGSEEMVDAQRQAAQLVQHEQLAHSVAAKSDQKGEKKKSSSNTERKKPEPASEEKPVPAKVKPPPKPAVAPVASTAAGSSSEASSSKSADADEDAPLLPNVFVDKDNIPAFFDFDRRSVVLSILRKKFW